MKTRGVFLLLAAVEGLTVAVLLHRGLPLAWDEVEFFRATKWVAEGRMPFRDFWEHHLPLQWLLFAPMAKWIDSPGVIAVIALRWAQVPLWLTTFALLHRLMVRLGASEWARWCSLLLLGSSFAFASAAVEYRVDTLGSLGLVAALALVASSEMTRARWTAFSAVVSLAVLANMRLAPLAIAFGLLMLFTRLEDRRWGWNARAMWMIAGVAAVAVPFVAWIYATGAWSPFLDGVVEYNLTSDRLVRGTAGSLGQVLTIPFRWRDVGAVALLLAAGAAAARSWRHWRRPDLRHVLALLAAAAIGSIVVAAIHYHYHLQIVLVLLAPLAAAGFSSVSGAHEAFRRGVTTLVTAASIVLLSTRLLGAGNGAGLEVQDRVMREADRRTAPEGRVWDGCGYALRREPAYRYWFLPAGVRAMARRGLVEPYDVRQMAADPPAAIVYNERVHHWLVAFPSLARYVVHHYVPLERNLWIPGLSTAVPAGRSRAVWTAPAAGRFEVWTSELLVKHPWFSRPLLYGRMEGEDAAVLEIPLRRLPRLSDESLQWSVDGVALPRGTRSLVVRRHSRVELVAETKAPAGVLLVPEGVTSICRTPPERFAF